MIQPKALLPDKEFTIVGEVFGTPLVVVGKTWFPLTEIIVWGIMAREAGRLHPERSWLTRMGLATLTMPVALGSEWCHNLAHAATAKMIGHPADAIRVTWGMPLLVYHDTEDANVSPRAHIVRALGGPIINTIFTGVAVFLRPLMEPNSIAREVVNTALGMNTFLVLAGMLPIPGIDGGAALKWALVEKGLMPAQADDVIRKVDTVTAAGLGVGAVMAFKKRKHLLAGIFAMFAGIALAVGTSLLREKK